MNDSGVPLVLVTGDLVRDCHLYGGVKTAATSFREPGTEYVEHDGGAALSHGLLAAAAKAHVQAELEQAKREMEAEAKRARVGKVEERELAAAARVLQDRIHKLEAACEEGGHWAVELGIKLHSKFPKHLRSYGVWTARPSRKGAKERVWRVEHHFGYGPTDGASSAGGLERQAPDRRPALTVIDDGAILFRHRRSKNAWPSPLGEGHFLLKMCAPLCQGDLWPELATVHERLIVVVSAADLRREDAQISHRLSWEKCAEDTLSVLENDSIVRELCSAAHVVVTFGAEGALWLRREKNGEHSARLVFSWDEQEGDHARYFEGTVYGFSTCVIAGIGYELMRRHATPTDSEPDPFGDPAAIGQAMEQGIVSGLRARRRLLELGHGAVGSEKPGFPLSQIGDELVRRGGGFISVEVPAASCRPTGCQWTILQQSEGTAPDATPLAGLARLTARFGPGALSHVPALRLGNLFTVDRSEIESLRTLETLIRAYEATPVQKKPLSIGVFGPPGAGKSFAVKALAKAVLGDKAPFLEFNLSQFKSPDELIGAFHQVRDAVLLGTTPVAFWDEFDSQHYKWLQYLLAPMQDGAFQDGQITHPIGKCAFVFAGGTSPTLEAFSQPDLPADATEEDLQDHKREQREFRMLKGPDFISRLHGHLEVLGPNAPQNPRCPDITWPIRRALLLRALLGLKTNDELDVDPGLLHALLTAPKYTHGARSFEKIVQALVQGRVDGRLQRSALPAEALLGRETNATKFYELMQERDAFRNHPDIERLAEAAHEYYSKDLKPELRTPYAKLDADLRASNRATARRIPDHLALIDFAIEPQDDDHTWTEALEVAISRHVERLAQAEHLGWCQERTSNGWIYADIRNNDLKHHPSMVEWSKLSASDREKDRKNVRAIPGMLEVAKYKAVRKGG